MKIIFGILVVLFIFTPAFAQDQAQEHLLMQERLVSEIKSLKITNGLLAEKSTLLEQNNQHLSKVIEVQNSQMADLKALVAILNEKELNYQKIIANQEKQFALLTESNKLLEKKLASSKKKSKFATGLGFVAGLLAGFKLSN